MIVNVCACENNFGNALSSGSPGPRKRGICGGGIRLIISPYAIFYSAFFAPIFCSFFPNKKRALFPIRRISGFHFGADWHGYFLPILTSRRITSDLLIPRSFAASLKIFAASSRRVTWRRGPFRRFSPAIFEAARRWARAAGDNLYLRGLLIFLI